MMFRKPKADVKKALPNIYKSIVEIGGAFAAGFMLAHYAVDTYGGVWPNVGGLTLLIDLGEKFGLWGAGGIGIKIAWEIYRKRA